MHLLLVGIGGLCGTLARYLLDAWITDATRAAFPWGTLVINLSGSFAIGVLFVLTVERGTLPAELRAPLGIGFLGGYTTFSTFMLESLRLAEGGAWPLALANIAGSMILGLGAVIAGVALARAIAA